MRGEYFSWLSHDDVYNVDKIKKEISALSEIENKLTLISCGTEFIDSDSKILNIKKHKRRQNNFEISWQDALLSMYKRNTYNGCTFLIHKDVFKKCGEFNENYRYNQDGLMWSTIFLNHFPMCSISYIGVKSRIHSGQLTRKGSSLFHKECKEMSDFLLPRLINCTNHEYRFVFEYAKYNAKHQNRAVVKKVLCEANYDTLSASERVVVMAYCLYGNIRFFVRKIYYKLFRKIDVS